MAELEEDWSYFQGQRQWDDEQALVRWQQTFGPTRVDRAIQVFLRHEVRQRGPKVAMGWQKLVARFLGIVIEYGMPMHRMTADLGHRATFQEMNRQALNGEHALLLILGTCEQESCVREVIPGIASHVSDWIDGRWRPLFKEGEYGYWNLMGINLSGEDLAGASLFGANLSDADLSGASLFGTVFTQANLSGAVLLGPAWATLPI